MRLIDADDLEEGKFHSIKNLTPVESALWQWGWNDAIDAIVSNAPTIDAEPVRHGHWELSPFDGNWTCSKCGNKPYHSNMKNMNYCPNCGAKMEEEDETD